MTGHSRLLNRRDVLTAAVALPAAHGVFLATARRLPTAGRMLTALDQPSPLYMGEYTVATFADAEGWLLLKDDDTAGVSDWRQGRLTYDFRHGSNFVGISNRLDALRGTPEALILALESDGGGQALTIRLADSTNQYFDATIARLERASMLRAERSLHDLGGQGWTVFGGAGDGVPHPPLTVRAIFISPGPGRRLGRVQLQNLSVHTRLHLDDGVRLSIAPRPHERFALSVENLLPVPNAISLTYRLTGLDGAQHGHGAARLSLPANAQSTHSIAVDRTELPPVVQLTAHAGVHGHVEAALASLVHGATPPIHERLAGMGLHAALTTRVLPREMARFAAVIAGCGVSWIREDFSWPQMSPLSNRVSMRRHDRAIDVAAKAGLRIVGLPTTWPYWSHAYTARGQREFLSFLGQIARRYKGRVAAWEVWNEPNVPTSWRGTAEQYTDLLAAAYATLKEIDPGVLVVGPCAAGPGDLTSRSSLASLAWIEQVLDGHTPLFDIFSFHPYEVGRSPEQAGLVQTVQRLRQMLLKAGRPARLWITEQGWPSGIANSALDDMQQARLLVRAYLLSRMAGVEMYFWYDVRNDGLALADPEDNFGLLRRDFTAKAAHRALAVVAAVLGARRCAGALPAPAGTAALRFVGLGMQEPVLALWAQPSSSSLSLTLRGRSGMLHDLDGTQTPLSPGRHSCRLPAGLVRFVMGDAALSTPVLAAWDIHSESVASAAPLDVQ